MESITIDSEFWQALSALIVWGVVALYYLGCLAVIWVSVARRDNRYSDLFDPTSYERE